MLAERRRWRSLTLFALYFAQGVPEGLLYVAVPAWLATNGASAAEIGSFIGIILLPWSFKMLNGVLMDRFQFPAMGRRRPWIIGAQLVLVGAMVAMSLQAPQPGDLFLLSLSGFLINMAAAFQDVAIDGMAIDIVPEDERGTANGLMWGGKTLGIAGSAIICGALIADWGFAAAVLAPAATIAAILLLPLLLRERAGERLLPWTPGDADGAVPAPPRLWRLLATLAGVMVRPANVLLALGIFVAFAAYGLKTALVPVFAVQQLGWDQQGFTRLAGGADIAGGLFGIAASGWIADRLGYGRAVVVSLLLLAALHGGMALAGPLWPQPLLFGGYFVVHALLFVLLSVSVYARAMAACDRLVAATQFSAFMAMLNLGTSFGAQQLGLVQGAHGSSGVFAAAAGLCLAAILLFWASGRALAAQGLSHSIR
ncbi:MFS transporter [Polymorphobacter multimanifer]|uniref:MFS transporter n=1 Tax=Polymorphobacter multimanifer TaxID=1070431 RepID=UPI001FB180E7|nr:MFS transporter [Polymorphobacter multimanifer]